MRDRIVSHRKPLYALAMLVAPLLMRVSNLDVSGERIRKDVTDGEEGVPLAVDIQIVDMETCEPIPNVYLEIWRKSTPRSPPTEPF